MAKALKQLLLIGDESTQLQQLAMSCQDSQLSTIIAPTLTIAHEKMQQHRLDLLVIDLDLKRKPNVELIRDIDFRSPYTPLILLTNDYQQSQQLIFGLFELDVKGSWHILEKPFKTETFVSHIKDILLDEENDLAGKSDIPGTTRSERRKFLRKVQFQPIRFSYEQSTYGSRFKTVTRGFLADVSLGGISMLTNRTLEEQQYLSFENGLLCGTGRVAWRSMIDDTTHKVGIRFG